MAGRPVVEFVVVEFPTAQPSFGDSMNREFSGGFAGGLM
jgi:hypothetical protein